MGAEGLIKPLDITTGLSDLPWHKDCGQGGHSYMCSGMTVGISVTGADRRSGALGVVPGSHRANVQTAILDPSLDLAPRLLETRTGDLTVHCSDTLHKSHRPKDRPRKVVYSGFRLPSRPGDVVRKVSQREQRAARARLTNVRDRIDASESRD
jgi:ectoine hydroxylase-related dioxygenase (phytanoyl-CoA dioxygenase family)